MTEEHVEWRTTFKPSDAPPEPRQDNSENKRDHYNRLAVANTLDWNGKWRRERRVTAKSERGLLDAIGSQLELTDLQRERAVQYYNQLPDEFLATRKNGMGIKVLVCCALSGRKDGRDYHPNNLRAEDSSGAFVSLAGDLNVSYGEFFSLWERVKSEVNDGFRG